MAKQPVNVLVEDLQAAQQYLTNEVTYYINNPPPDSFGVVTSFDFNTALSGLQQNNSQILHTQHDSAASSINTGWQQISSAVNAFANMLQQSINAHTTTDTNNADAANTTNTGTPGSTTPSSTSPTPGTAGRN